MMKRLRAHKWWTISGVGVLLVAGAVGTVVLFSGQLRGGRVEASDTHGAQAFVAAGDEDETSGSISVKTIHPKRDAALEVTVEQPAYVHAYYRAALHARVAGPVKYIQKVIGNAVKPNELLVDIDVPDLVAAVQQKQAIVQQRQRDLSVADASVRIAQASQVAAEHTIKEYESRLNAAREEKEFRWKRYARFKELGKGPSPAVTPDIVDEEFKWCNVAAANQISAEAALLRAQANLEEAKQKVEGARADVELKKSLIQVAEEDRKQAQCLRDLATIRAPFTGVVTQRGADPGTFVHNAATAIHTDPLLTIERTDIVTVVMKVPDKYAAYIGKDTEAVITLDELRGTQLRAKVTRFTPSLQTPEHDRTMRVEVDLYNGSAAEFTAFKEREEKSKMEDLKGDALQGNVLPNFPQVEGSDGTGHRLLPGMYGTMRLVIRRFRNVYLLPSQAVVRQGGTPFIYEVTDGVVHRIPVVVEMDDGKLARVQVLVPDGKQERRHELTGHEEIVASNQGELTDGQNVEASHLDW